MRYLVVLLLAGCATQPEMLWDKQGWNQAEFNADSGQCRAQGLSVPGAMTVNAMQSVAVFASCMQGKGYYQRPAY